MKRYLAALAATVAVAAPLALGTTPAEAATRRPRLRQRASLALPVLLCLVGLGMVGAPAASAAKVDGHTCTVVGTRHADQLIGTPGRDVICGLGGRDVLTGGGGADVLLGGSGADTLTGGRGADTLRGGSGQDTASYRDHRVAVIVDLDGAADDGTRGERDQVATDVENLLGGAGPDRLTGSASGNRFDGGAGSDLLAGGSGADQLTGGLGNDTIGGGGGNDVLTGDLGDDRLDGGAGDDRLDGGGGDDLLIGGTGADRIDGGTGTNTCTQDANDPVVATCRNDVDAPVISLLDHPGTLVAGSSLTVTWRATDASGVSFSTAWVRSPTGVAVPGCGGSAATRTSGTATDGRYTQTCTIPVGAVAGTYTVSVQAQDTVGNTHNAADGSFTVTGGGNDVDAPVISLLDHPGTLVAGSSLTVTWRATDASGVSFSTAWVRSPTGVAVPGCGGSAATRTSGTATDGRYTQTCTIPVGAVAGTYTVSVQAQDTVGNTHNAADGSFTVTGGGNDVDAPVISLLDHPGTLVAGSSLTVTWRATDASGVSFSTAWVRSPTGVAVPGCGGSAATRTSGTATDGRYTQTCTIPVGAVAGTYTVSVQAQDTVGNTHNAADGSFTVTGGGNDVDAPVISLLDHPGTLVAGSSLTVTWRATDASGVSFSTAWVRSPTGVAVPGCGGSAATRTSGTATDGRYTQTCTIPVGAVAGTYTVSVQAQDTVGNTHNAADGSFTVTGGGNDVDAPVISLLDHPGTLVAGSSLTVTWRATDASGVSFSTAWVRSPTGVAVPGCGGSAATRTSGTATDGRYTQTCTIPVGAVAGTYTVSVQAQDTVGNTHNAADGSFTVTLP